MIQSRLKLSVFAAFVAMCLCVTPAGAKDVEDPALKASHDREKEFWKLVTIPLPEDVVLEVGGLMQMADGRLMAATRRGEVFIIENAYADPPAPVFKRYAFGLAEPLGLLEHEGWIYFAQRGELSRMKDLDGDDRADVFETVCDDWAISGSYHEYAFGPRLGPEGHLWVTLNKPFGPEPYGFADWRGWAVRVDLQSGKMKPMAVGLRSPAGIEVSPWGDVFYTDNQGEWCNASKMSQIEFGDFHGHPHGLPTTYLPESPIKPLPEGEPVSGSWMKDLHERVPNFKMPAVWFPYNKMGNSPSGMKWDQTGGKFGPFEGQVFVGDQNHAWVMRVFLEKIDGHWQGACFEFHRQLQSGVTRLAFGKDHSLFVGMTSRGWGGLGSDPYGLQRLVWTGKTPFEVHEMRVKPDGFELTFTQKVDAEVAANPATYWMESYTYQLRSNYGGPEDDKLELGIKSAQVAADGMSVRLVVDPLRAGYVHELHMKDLVNADGERLLHNKAYYTVVNIPNPGE